MARFVSSEWVASRLEMPDVVVLDPRRPTKYLQGHLRNAVNVPLAKAWDADGRLRPPGELAAWLGEAGLGEGTSPLLYDAADGRYAAMLAWLLEYLGRTDVQVMDVFLEGWVAEGRPIFYRPVRREPGEFPARVVPAVRAALEDVRQLSSAPQARGRAGKLTDFRSRDEYMGRQAPPPLPGPEGEARAEAYAGHIPGAISLAWEDLAGDDHRFLASSDAVRRRVEEAGITPGDRIVAYCQTGARAAVGYVALRSIGLDVSLFDGSYAEWMRQGLPVEVVEIGRRARLRAGRDRDV